ncbi:hypothetical protein KCU71_g224, partial [Aureobasidium melanogenum]
MTSAQPILKQIAAIRRKAGLTRQEFFDHHFQIHGTLSDGGDQKPAKYVQTHVFDSAFSAPLGGLPNSNHSWFSRDDVAELYFRSPNHIKAVFGSEYVRTTIGPDGRNFNDFETAINLMAIERREILTGSDVVERVEDYSPTVAMWFLASTSGNADGHTIDDTFTPVLIENLEDQLSDHALELIVSTGIKTDFDLRKYFGGQNMPVYSMVYKVLLKSPSSVSAFRKMQIKLSNDLPAEVDASSSFVLFGQEGLVLDDDAGIRGVVLISFSGLINIIGAGALARYIVADIGGSDRSIWLSQVSAITVTLLGPAIAQATDLWGRKWFVVSTTLLGFAGSLVVSRATTINVAIAGEILAALGYSSQALLNAIASEILPRRYRPAAQGGLGLTSGLGAAFSLLLGFYLCGSSTEGWRLFWYIVAALQFLAALLFTMAYNPPPRACQLSMTMQEKLSSLDWTAYFLLGIGIVGFNIGLTYFENPYSFHNAHVAVPFAIGTVSLVAFVVHQSIFKKDGLCNHKLFERSRNVAVALLLMFVEGLTFFCYNSFFASEMAILYETDTFRVGLRASVVFWTTIASSIAVSTYSSINKDLKHPVIAAYGFIVIFSILMATATLESSTAVWAYPVFLGLGLGAAISNVFTIAQLSAPSALIAITSGLIAGVRSFGGSVALPIFNSVYKSTNSKHLGPNIIAAVVPLGLPKTSLQALASALAANNAEAVAKIPGMTPQIAAAAELAVKKTFLLSYRYVWIIMACFSFLGTVAACFLKDTKEDMTMSVDAPLNRETVAEESND